MSERRPPEFDGPPRTSEAFLSLVLPERDRGPVLGDLAEEYTERVETEGRARARWWYRRQVLRSLIPGARRRLDGDADRRGSDRTASGDPRPARTVGSRLGLSRLDLKLAGRMLFKRPGLTLAALFALAVGIPAGMAPLHLYDTIQAPLPEDPENRIRAVRFWDTESNRQVWPSYFAYAVWREELTSFEAIGAARERDYNLSLGDGNTAPVAGAQITASVFDMLRAVPHLGRTIDARDQESSAPNVVVLGYDLWQTRMGADPDIVGTTLRLGRESATVVGVMPQGFLFPIDQQLWVPLRDEASPQPGEGAGLQVFGRLAEGASTQDVQAEATTVAQRLTADAPERYRRLQSQVVPFGIASMYMQGSGPGGLIQLYVFQALCLVLLLIACANVAMLTFARSTSRVREMSIRTALGATRSRIVFQMFLESLVLAVAAAGIGLVSFQLILDRVRASVASGPSINIELLPYWFDLGISSKTLLLAVVWATVSAAVVSVLPALSATKKSVRTSIDRARARRSGVRFGGVTSFLVVADVAVAVAALGVGVGLSGRVMDAMSSAERVGIPAGDYLSVRLSIPQEALPVSADSAAAAEALTSRRAVLQQDLEARLAAEPGVRSVGFASHLPRMDHAIVTVEVEGATGPADTVMDGPAPSVNAADVDLGYFEALDQPILAGRGFGEDDLGENAHTAIVNSSFVARILDGRNPIGQRFRVRTPMVDEPSEWYEIVGVVGLLGTNLAEPEHDAGVYFPAPPGQIVPLRAAIHLDGVPDEIATRIRAIVSQADPEAVVEALPLNRVFQRNWYGFLLLSIGMLPGVLILIATAACGIYALLSFAISERTLEIGVRTALGATAASIVARVARRSLAQIGAGALLGIPLAVAGLSFMGEWTTTSSLGIAVATAVGVTVLIATVSLVSPTRRALKIEPTEALRAER